MDSAALTLALTAGALAALNPCGFAMLPAYLSIFVLADAEVPQRMGGARLGPTAAAMGRAVRATGLMTLGFVAVFGAFGLLVAPAASAAQEYLPYVTAVTGVLLALAGLVLVSGRRLTMPIPQLRAARGRGVGAMFLYGVVYALASLTCTIGPFLAIVVTSLRADAVREGIALYGAYALGMGLVVGVAALAVALASQTVLTRLRGTGRWLPRLVGGLLLVVGAYVAWYGVWEIRVLGGADPTDPVVDTALEIQRWLNDRVRSVLPG